jgi:hypothetical protein
MSNFYQCEAFAPPRGSLGLLVGGGDRSDLCGSAHSEFRVHQILSIVSIMSIPRPVCARLRSFARKKLCGAKKMPLGQEAPDLTWRMGTQPATSSCPPLVGVALPVAVESCS